jgi:hypothetical protein
MPKPPKVKPSKAHPVTRRCRNCPKMFPATREEQHFCSAQCRRQFHHVNNTGYGRVKHIVERTMRIQMREIERQAAAILKLDQRIYALEMWIKLHIDARLPTRTVGLAESRTDVPGLR